MQQVAPLINQAFGQLQLIFGRKYASRFTSKNELDATKRMWAKAFIQEAIKPEQVAHAIQRIISAKLEWPPELPEFLNLCDDPQALGLPEKHQALQQIIDRHGKYRFVEQFTWLHRVVEVINQHIGHHVTQEAASSFERRFNTEWKRIITQFKAGTLPEPRPLLSYNIARKLPPVIPQQWIDEDCQLQKRLASLRTQQRGPAHD